MNDKASISIVKSCTVHALSRSTVFKIAYLVSFLSLAATMFLSKNIVFSLQINSFFDTENITISGRWLVSSGVSGGMVLLLSRSNDICKSVGDSVWKMDSLYSWLDLGFVPCFTKFWTVFFLEKRSFVRGRPITTWSKRWGEAKSPRLSTGGGGTMYHLQQNCGQDYF